MDARGPHGGSRARATLPGYSRLVAERRLRSRAPGARVALAQRRRGALGCHEWLVERAHSRLQLPLPARLAGRAGLPLTGAPRCRLGVRGSSAGLAGMDLVAAPPRNRRAAPRSPGPCLRKTVPQGSPHRSPTRAPPGPARIRTDHHPVPPRPGCPREPAAGTLRRPTLRPALHLRARSRTDVLRTRSSPAVDPSTASEAATYTGHSACSRVSRNVISGHRSSVSCRFTRVGAR